MKKQKKERQYATGKPEGAFEEWLVKLGEKLVEIYQLGAITIYFKKAKSKAPKDGVTFTIKYSQPYRTASITYFPIAEELFAEKAWFLLTNAVTHEFAHIITEPLAQLADKRHVTKEELCDTTESVTEHVAILARELLEKKFKTV